MTIETGLKSTQVVFKNTTAYSRKANGANVPDASRSGAFRPRTDQCGIRAGIKKFQWNRGKTRNATRTNHNEWTPAFTPRYVVFHKPHRPFPLHLHQPYHHADRWLRPAGLSRLQTYHQQTCIRISESLYRLLDAALEQVTRHSSAIHTNFKQIWIK